jgi:hypothetical protein
MFACDGRSLIKAVCLQEMSCLCDYSVFYTLGVGDAVMMADAWVILGYQKKRQKGAARFQSPTKELISIRLDTLFKIHWQQNRLTLYYMEVRYY